MTRQASPANSPTSSRCTDGGPAADEEGTARRLPPKYEEEGHIVSTLRRQLAVFPGKTHTVPFAFGGIGGNAHAPDEWTDVDPATSGRIARAVLAAIVAAAGTP